ncbi:hypothetical protein IWZ03DRAFT_383712 [Phyllosticta citriasiana]|uniref:Uncharacterized protein n=1 Tax=Phyllosticta citriasiana TaxID=595635 RepID=A0ABR1KIG8_9PEZI
MLLPQAFILFDFVPVPSHGHAAQRCQAHVTPLGGRREPRQARQLLRCLFLRLTAFRQHYTTRALPAPSSRPSPSARSHLNPLSKILHSSPYNHKQCLPTQDYDLRSCPCHRRLPQKKPRRRCRLASTAQMMQSQIQATKNLAMAAISSNSAQSAQVTTTGKSED